MFVYARNMQLALSDQMRRAGVAAGGGGLLAIGAGFLLAALWSYLAREWGPVAASLTIGGALMVIGAILLAMSRRTRHPIPNPEELRVEIAQQMNLMANSAVGKVSDAADAAIERASAKAGEVLDLTENRIHRVADDLGYRANRVAEQAEARVYTTVRNATNNAAERFGFASESHGAGALSGRNAAPIIGALAIGLTVASRLKSRPKGDDRHHRT
ncbi:phage holin family protein [Paracoccus ravus]|uniref:phage holin family protein n=1 Tax=Paracoccus ravus TaxID=2447760 RepID=UPI00106E89CA|nr:phage holin family protein [Paracoccus ravus]